MNRIQIPAYRIILVAGALAFLAGGLFFSFSKYKPSTLLLDAKAIENGVGLVLVHGVDGSTSEVSFDVEGGESRESLHVIELPAISLSSLRLAPLSRYRAFEIHRITLVNDEISYSWDAEGACSQKQMGEGIFKQEACTGTSPILTVTDDGSVNVSSIPEKGTKRALLDRAVIGFLSGAVSLFSLLWLLWPRRANEPVETTALCLGRFSWLAFMLIYLSQFYIVCRYSVDAPYYDEWLYFQPDALTREFSVKWVFSQYVDHFIVPTKFMAWLNLNLLNLDFRLQKIINYLLFGGMLGSLFFLKKRLIGSRSFVWFPLFMIFLLTPLSQENHRWAFQSQIHLALLFSNIALCFAFVRSCKWTSCLAYSLFVVSAMYTFASGVIFTLVCTISMGVAFAFGYYGPRCRSLWIKMLFTWTIVGGNLAVWFWRYKKPVKNMFAMTDYTFPTDTDFWVYFLNQLSFSFGFEDYSLLPGIILLLLCLIPVAWLYFRHDAEKQQAAWSLFVATLYTFAILAAISMSRTFVDASAAKTSRYTEIFGLLIPYLALGWWLVIEAGRRRTVLLVFIWCACFISFFDTWSPNVYRFNAQVDNLTLECADRYYSGGGRDTCQDVVTPEILDRARMLGVKFTRRLAP